MANVVEFSIRGVDKFSGTMGRMNSAIATTAKVAAVTSGAILAAGTALTVFVNKITRGQNEAAQFATRLGIATDKLTEFQFAANQSNVSSQNLNLSIQRMTRRVAEAAAGTGEAKDAIRDLGFVAKDLGTLSIDQQFLAITDALEGTSSSAERLRLAFKLFDSEGTSVLQVVNSQSNAFRELAKDAQFLGVSLGAGAAANAKEFQNQLGRVGAAVSGVSQAISNELAPVMAGLAKSLANAIAEARPKILELTKMFLGAAIGIGIIFDKVFQAIGEEWDKAFTAKGFLDLLKRFKDFGIRVMALWSKVTFNLGVMLINAVRIAFLAAFEIAKTGIQNIIDLFTGGNLAPTLEQTFEGLAESLGPMLDSLDAQFESFKNSILENAEETKESLAGAFGIDLDTLQSQIDAALEKLSLFGEEAKTTFQDTGAETSDFFQELFDINNAFMENMQTLAQAFAIEFHNLMQTTINAISQSIAQTIVEGGSLLQAFKQVGKQILAGIIQILIKVGLQRLLTAAIGRAANTAEASANMATGAATTFINAAASTAAIPIVGPALAIPVATATTAAALAGAAAAGGTGAALGATISQAASGLESVPNTGTFLVHAGERILSPEQNRDLTSFLGGGGSGGSTIIENIQIHVLENATNGDSLLQMDANEIREVVAAKIIPALNDLDNSGIRPNAAERQRNV